MRPPGELPLSLHAVAAVLHGVGHFTGIEAQVRENFGLDVHDFQAEIAGPASQELETRRGAANVIVRAGDAQQVRVARYRLPALSADGEIHGPELLAIDQTAVRQSVHQERLRPVAHVTDAQLRLPHVDFDQVVAEVDLWRVIPDTETQCFLAHARTDEIPR